MKSVSQKRLLSSAVGILALLWIASAMAGAGQATSAGDSNCSLPEARLLLADASAAAGDFKPLIGRWRRPDGGYVLEVRSIEPNGKMDVYYFNPNSIHVQKGEATRVDSDIKMVVELRDVGYPGSTYALLYKPEQDILKGYYYQAGMKQYFEVVFVRQK
jgi:hypothetical protein